MKMVAWAGRFISMIIEVVDRLQQKKALIRKIKAF